MTHRKNGASDRKCILLADDEPSVVKLTKFRLEHEGYDVVVATDGEETLRQAESAGRIDLVLLDVWMPKLNGYDVCRALKRHAATAHIPVIVFTASEAELQYLGDQCIEAGASDWIKKPFQAKELLQKVRRALKEEGGDS